VPSTPAAAAIARTVAGDRHAVQRSRHACDVVLDGGDGRFQRGRGGSARPEVLAHDTIAAGRDHHAVAGHAPPR
jgi:hypothetical protein